MPRGFVWAQYVDDDDTVWRLRVDADEAQELQRGWDTTDALLFPPVPRGWLPRRAVALDSSGRQQTARIGRLDADLWTGVADSFVLMLSDGTTDTAQVVALQGELRLG